MVVEPRQLHSAKGNAPVSVIDLFEANELTNQRLAQVQSPSSPFDFAVASNATHARAFGVLDLRLSKRVRSLRGPEVVSRSRAAERFMRSLVVVLFSKLVEPPLLRAQLEKQFAGAGRVQVAQIKRLVDDRTDYREKHMRAVLRRQETEGTIKVHEYKTDGRKRKRGTFPKEVVLEYVTGC